MDPASAAIGVVSGSAALAALAVQITTYLLGLRDTYKDSEIIILDLAATCQAFEIAWRRIHEWASSWVGNSTGTQADPIFRHLVAYHETGSLVLKALNAELVKITQPSNPLWRLSPKSKKSKVSVVLHRQGLKDHTDILSHQVSSLNLLLSTAQLSNHPKVQDVVLDLLQPVFRKDEESAWTVVKSRQSTKRPLSSSLFTRSNHCATIDETAPMESKHFDFENELIVGPVYKRVLFAHLCTLPASSFTKSTNETRTSDLDPIQGARSGAGQEIDLEINTDHTIIRDIDWSPENIVKILKQSGGFSISVLADLQEVKDATNSLRLAKRTLPLGSILKQNRMPPEEQKYQNAKLIMGVAIEDAELVAQALEDGAEINTVSDDGHTALQMSLEMSPTSDIAALLLLYREANRNFRDVAGEPILLQAVRRGNIALVEALIAGVEDLRLTGNDGEPLLHVAVRSRHHGLKVLKELGRIFAEANINPDMYLDRHGKSALHAAVHERSTEHIIELIRLGCDPSFMPRVSKHTSPSETVASPLYFAVQSGDVELVQLILEESSAMPDLVNWRHHPQHSLLDFVKQSSSTRRFLMAKVLIQHGAKWNITWKQPDHLLEFAMAGRSSSLLLMAVSMGCLPLMKSLDITELLPDLQKNTSKVEAVRTLWTLIKSNNPDADDSSKPRIFAWMADKRSPGHFRETSSLIEILQGIIATEEPAQSATNAALSPTDSAKDPTLPLSIALRGNGVSLGQLMYHMDRSLIDTSGHHEIAAKERLVHMFCHESMLKIKQAAQVLPKANVETGQPDHLYMGKVSSSKVVLGDLSYSQYHPIPQYVHQNYHEMHRAENNLSSADGARRA